MELTSMTDTELANINKVRQRKGLPPLTRVQAATAVVSAPDRTSSGFNTFNFLIGYETGIGFTPEGMLGAMFHHSSDPAPSYSSPDTNSSSSSDSSSSSSYDSGSSSSNIGSSSSSDGGS